ncbi:hypothetical protein [Nocardiopsis lucentensis]|nr:hypothetical protein [Nocardiopsis lucentensis]
MYHQLLRELPEPTREDIDRRIDDIESGRVELTEVSLDDIARLAGEDT